MENEEVLRALSALAHESRLAVFRLLVQTGPAGLPVGAIGETLGLAPATLSFHLAGLRHAGLVRARRQGRTVLHAADFAAMNALVAYLSENCCQGADCGVAPRAGRTRAAAPSERKRRLARAARSRRR